MAWLKTTDDQRFNLKLQQVSDSAKVLNDNARQHCNHRGTDGLVWKSMLPDVVVGMSGKKVEQYIRELVEVRKPGSDAGLWHAPGETCDHSTCPAAQAPVPPGAWAIHDYFAFLPDPEKAAATSAARSEAGRRGGLASARARTNGKAKSKQIASILPEQSKQNPSKQEANGTAKLNPVSRIPYPVPPNRAITETASEPPELAEPDVGEGTTDPSLPLRKAVVEGLKRPLRVTGKGDEAVEIRSWVDRFSVLGAGPATPSELLEQVEKCIREVPPDVPVTYLTKCLETWIARRAAEVGIEEESAMARITQRALSETAKSIFGDWAARWEPGAKWSPERRGTIERLLRCGYTAPDLRLAVTDGIANDPWERRREPGQREICVVLKDQATAEKFIALAKTGPRRIAAPPAIRSGDRLSVGSWTEVVDGDQTTEIPPTLEAEHG